MNYISTSNAITQPFTQQVKQLKSKTKASFHPTPDSVRVLNNSNRYSRFLVQGEVVGVTNNLSHPVEIVDVIADHTPYNLKLTHKFISKTLVNMGTYFKGVSTINHLVTLDDYEAFINKYTPCDYIKFCKDHNTHQEFNKLKGGNISPELEVYALSKECPIHFNRVIRPLKQVRSNPSGADKIVMHHELNDEYDIERCKFFMKHNYKIIRYLQQGNQEPLTCRFSGYLVEGVTLPLKIIGEVTSNQFDLHHILVKGKKSVLKGAVDPAKILRNGFLDDKENKDSFIDLLGTVVASKSYHMTIHEIRDSGIEYYKDEYLPWVLQSKENFDKACAKYDLGLDYEEYFNSLKLSSLNKELK